ncbi:MAG: hypothetical protein EBU88_16305 [Acidobacteria bacterium]|nr:hypothetical protein [Acidobacteriota bacterium]
MKTNPLLSLYKPTSLVLRIGWVENFIPNKHLSNQTCSLCVLSQPHPDATAALFSITQPTSS